MAKRRNFAGSPEKVGQMAGQDKTVDLQFVKLVEQRCYREALDLVAEVDDINTIDPESRSGALHWAAARAARNFIEALASIRDDLDFLAVDGNGRRASEVAWHAARDEGLGAWLMHREKEQALKTGMPTWSAPEPSR